MSSDLEVSKATVGEAVRRYQAATDDFDRLVAQVLGINRTDARCLELLVFDFPHGATPAELGIALGLTSGSVTTSIDRLVRAEHVVRRRHEKDGRKVVVQLRDGSRHRTFDLYRSLVERGAALLSRYSPNEISCLIDFFTRATELQREEEARLRAQRQ